MRPERNPEWLINNDWSAESRLNWVKKLGGEKLNDWTKGVYNDKETYTNRIAMYYLSVFDDKELCEFCWNRYVENYNIDHGKQRKNKPKDLDVVLQLLNENKTITEIADHFNVTETTIKRWMKQIKIEM